jgi:type II secretory pathway component PulK
MRVHTRQNRSGIALIIVMLVIVVLGILAGAFAYSMKVETTLARHATRSSDLDWAGRSGVEVAKWVLSQGLAGPQGPVGSIKREWGDFGATNDALAEVDLKHYELTDGSRRVVAVLSIDIKDLDRKFNINVADEYILGQAMTLIGVDAAASSTIIGSILDWRDPDSKTHMNGTETDYYEGLDPPYYCKDGPIDDLSELLLVRGVTPAMYWGSSSGGVPPVLNRSSHASRSMLDEPTYAVGLVDLFTPVSSRLINLNTASATVLQLCHPNISYDVAQSIIARRAGMDGQEGTDDDMPFRSPAELLNPPIPGLTPDAAQALAVRSTVRSFCFEVHVSVDAQGTRREYVALLRRNGPKDIQTMNFHWK